MIYSFSGNFYGFQHTFFHQQRSARSCAFNGCIFNFNRKHAARTKYAQIQNDFRRIHLRFFSICNANARLDLRSHNFKHIFSLSKIHSVDCINSSPLHRTKNHPNEKLTFSALIIQGIATSIDALSVGFTIADYTLFFAFIASLIIALVTFIICMIGLLLGKSIGQKLSKADIFGGIILIAIGIEIFVKGVFFK